MSIVLLTILHHRNVSTTRPSYLFAIEFNKLNVLLSPLCCTVGA